MNEDFLIPKTPGNARLLMRLSDLNPSVTISPELRALASEGMLTDADFDALPVKSCAVRRKALQMILDLNLRCVVPEVHPSYSRVLPLMAAKVARASPVVVFSPHPDPWESAAIATRTKIVVATCDQVIDPAWQKDKREGVCIVDYQTTHVTLTMRNLMETIGREWARTIIYGDPDFDVTRAQPRLPMTRVFRAKHWSEAVGLMTMVSAIHPSVQMGMWPFSRGNPRARDLTARGFKNAHPSAIAFLFGLVVPSE